MKASFFGDICPNWPLFCPNWPLFCPNWPLFCPYLTSESLTRQGFQTPKKEKKKKKKRKGFFMKNSSMPSLKLGRFNLAKARLRGCFFSNDHWGPKAEKKQKRLWTRFARVFSKAKALDSKNYRAASIFKSGFSRGNKRTFIVSLVDTR